jgi:gas vesicle protein
MADSLKTLRVELTASGAGFQKVFKNASASVGGLGKELGGMQKALSVGFGAISSLAAPIAGAFAAVGGAVGLATKHTIDYASALADLAARSQHSVEWLQATKFAAEQSGTSLEAVTGASEKLRKALGEGSDKTTAAVRALGLSFQELRAASPDEQMNKVLGAIAAVGDATARTTITLQLLGKSGGELLPMVGSFEELRKQAEELGLVMAEKDVRAAEALGDSIDALESSFGGLVNNLGTTITSSAGVHEAVKVLTAALGDLSKWIAANRTEIRSFAVDGLGYLTGYISGVLSSIQLLVQAFFAMEKVGVDVTATFVRIATTARALQDVMSRPWAAGEIFSGLKTELGRITESQKAAIDSIEQKQSKMDAAFSSGQAVIVKTTAALQGLGAAEVKVGDGATGAAGGILDLGEASGKAAKDAESLAETLLAADKAFHAEAMKTWDEWGKNADENIKNVVSEYMRITGLLGPTTAQVAEQFKDLNTELGRRGGIGNLNDAELKRFISSMEDLGDTGKLTAEQYSVLGDAYTEAMQRGIIETEKAQKATIDWANVLDGVADLFGQFATDGEGAFARIADAAGEAAQAIKNVQAAGGLGTKAGKGYAVAGALSVAGTAFGDSKAGGALKGAGQGAAIGTSILPGWGTAIGAAVGAVAGFIGASKKLKKELKEIKESFIASAGGIDALKAKAKEAGVSLDAMMAAKNKNSLLKAIDEISARLNTWDEAQQALQEATERYGFTLAELGPAMQRQQLDQQAGQLLQDFKLLTASGISVGTVIGKMGPAMIDFVNTSRAAGQAIPEAMRPMIDQLITSGQLLDENGQAFTSAEDAGITFAQTMTEQFQTLIEKIDAMVSALLGIPSDVTTTVTTHHKNTYDGQARNDDGSPDYDGDASNSFREGTRGFVNFGAGTLAMLHGWEAVVPRDAVRSSDIMGGGATINVYPQFEENALQTYEHRQQLRDATVRTLYREASRDLASAVRSGGA